MSALPPVEIGDATGFIRLHRRNLDLVQPVMASHGVHGSRSFLIVEVNGADATLISILLRCRISIISAAFTGSLSGRIAIRFSGVLSSIALRRNS